MTAGRAAVRWEHLLAWTKANGIPDSALARDENMRMVMNVRRDAPAQRLYLIAWYRQLPLTWGQLRADAETEGAQAGDELWFDGERVFDDVKVVDLGDIEDEDGRHYLILQRRWG
jgi:hypothetical protein